MNTLVLLTKILNGINEIKENDGRYDRVNVVGIDALLEEKRSISITKYKEETIIVLMVPHLDTANFLNDNIPDHCSSSFNTVVFILGESALMYLFDTMDLTAKEISDHVIDARSDDLGYDEVVVDLTVKNVSQFCLFGKYEKKISLLPLKNLLFDAIMRNLNTYNQMNRNPNYPTPNYCMLMSSVSGAAIMRDFFDSPDAKLMYWDSEKRNVYVMTICVRTLWSVPENRLVAHSIITVFPEDDRNAKVHYDVEDTNVDKALSMLRKILN